MKSKKAFFYRINAGDLLAEVVAMSEKERGKWALSFALALQKGDKDHSQYVSTLIDEANGYIEKKKDAAHKRWNAPHMQNDAPHMQTDKVHMPEAVTEAEAVQKQKKESKSSRFTPPSLEDVQAYCLERKNGVNAGKWMDHYLRNGWRVGRAPGSPMKDWKAAVRTWESDAVPPQSKAVEQDHRRYL